MPPGPAPITTIRLSLIFEPPLSLRTPSPAILPRPHRSGDTGATADDAGSYVAAMAEDRVSATRRIAAPAATIFAIVSDPAGQVAIDGSHMLVQSQTPAPLTAVGDTFVIDMDREALGDRPIGKYSVENVVTRIEPDALIEWGVGVPGKPPFGHVYGYELVDAGDGSTDVTSYCDWSGIPEEFRSKVRWPIVPKMALMSTLENLERAATRNT
jgi:hypothetical protein